MRICRIFLDRVVDVTIVTYFHDTSVPIVAQILIACDNCYQHVPSVITLVLSHSQALLLGELV